MTQQPYIGGLGAQPMMSAAEAQVVGQMPTQPMLPGLLVAAPMAGVMPGLTPAFSQSRAADEHSEKMVRNLLLGFDMFERYFQQMQKHSELMNANNEALIQHTKALYDLEKQLTDVRKEGAKASADSAASIDKVNKKTKDMADTLSTVADNTQGAPEPAARPGQPGRQTSGDRTPSHGQPLSPEPPAPTNVLDDYRAGGLPRVVSSRMVGHYARRIKDLKGDRLNELEAMGKEGRSGDEESEYQGLLTKTAHARHGVRVAQNVESKGLMGALGGEFPMVARFAGVAGGVMAAYQGVQKIGQMVSGEREAASQYQQGIGGSEAGGAWQQTRERLFGYRNMFGMGDAQARELYRGVTGMGIDDAQGRQSALDFATKAFKDTGIQVSQSLDIIRTAASAGVTDFSALAGSINEVSKAARVGGISVAQATQMFTQNMQSVQGTVGGDTAISVATNLTTGLAQLGPEVANNVNLTGLYTGQTEQYRIASQLGITRSQLIAGEASNAAFAGQVGQQGLDQLVDAVLGGPGRAWVARRMQAQIKSGMSAQNAAREVAIEAMNVKVLDIDRARALAVSYDIPATDDMALAIMIVQAAAGGLNISGGGTQSGARTSARPNAQRSQVITQGMVSHSERTTQDKYGYDSAQTVALKHDLSVQEGQISQRLGYGTSNPLSTGNDDLTNYQHLVERFGKRDPVLEALLKKGVYDKDTRFRVQTADGPRDVSLGTAMHHYLDQLDRGDIEITAGQHKNHKVSEILSQQHVRTNPNATGANLDPRSAKDSSAQHAVGKGSTPSGASSATVVIRPSPDLQRILRLYPSGGAYIDTGRQSGQPSPAFAPYNDYPTSGTGYGNG